LGSKNGTYINGKKVDLVELGPRELADLVSSAAHNAVLNAGGLLTVGGSTLRADVVDCPLVRNDTEGKARWEAGATAKQDCLLPLCDIPKRQGLA
jgi:pSer/pThr/pTyr-binding forkhead associated (FHA) protein